MHMADPGVDQLMELPSAVPEVLQTSTMDDFKIGVSASETPGAPMPPSHWVQSREDP